MATIFSTLDKLAKEVKNINKQHRFATALALTKIAGDVRTETRKQMQSKIDKPTAYTLNSLMTKPAKKDDLVAEVRLKDAKMFKAKYSVEQTLAHLFKEYPTRNKSGLERYMTAAGFIRANEYLVPTSSAKIDSYGNLSRGQIQQIVSQLKITFTGYQNASDSSRSKGKRKRYGNIFWSDGSSGLHRGVWQRMSRDKPKLIIAVIRAPHYKQRINMEAIADPIIRTKWSEYFEEALKKAMGTARAR